MTQDERWLAKYKDVRAFIETNHRNPFKYYDGEKLMVHFLKWSRKPMNAGELKEPRLGMFKELLVLSEKYKRKNHSMNNVFKILSYAGNRSLWERC